MQIQRQGQQLEIKEELPDTVEIFLRPAATNSCNCFPARFLTIRLTLSASGLTPDSLRSLVTSSAAVLKLGIETCKMKRKERILTW